MKNQKLLTPLAMAVAGLVFVCRLLTPRAYLQSVFR